MHTTAAHIADSLILDRDAFERYLGVVNRTLVTVSDRFPYNALIGAFASTFAGRPLLVSIIGPATDEISLGCVLEGLEFRFAPAVPTATAVRWQLRREHVHAVIAEPWRYLADPSRLELPPFNLVGSAPQSPTPRRRHLHASRP